MIQEEMTLRDRLRGVWLGIRVRSRYAMGKRLPPRMPKTTTMYGGRTVPICPRCGDLVYYPKSCVTCGQRFKCESMTIGEVLELATED